jgi:outer membrane protein
MKLRILPLCLAMALAFAGTAQAQSLLQIYEAAKSHDATYKAARAQYEASLAKADQAKSALLPTAGLGYNVSRTDLGFEDYPSRDYAFNTKVGTVSASQPLYRPANLASYRQGQKSGALAQVQLDAAEQDLIVRLSQAYFDVLSSAESLTFVQAQKKAVAEQLASAKRNFEVGTSTITDSREAQARFDLVTAQEIAAENDLRVKKLALDQLSGLTNAQPQALSRVNALQAVEPGDVEKWVSQSQTQNPGVLQSNIALDVARLETEKAKAAHQPTVDLTASYAQTRYQNPSTSQFNTNSATVGIAVNLPLFAGFASENRIREAVALEEKARNDKEAAERNVAQATRTAFFGVQSGLSQVKALEAAEASSQSALDANKLGYQVGVRINIDVLNSQSQLFDTKAKLAKARYDVLVGQLKLRQASGTLKSDDLQNINSLLQK